jgi:hypothetical protein
MGIRSRIRDDYRKTMDEVMSREHRSPSWPLDDGDVSPQEWNEQLAREREHPLWHRGRSWWASEGIGLIAAVVIAVVLGLWGAGLL